MGILANTVSFCQYRVLGDLPQEDFFGWVARQLARNAFLPIDQSAEEISVGWVSLDDSHDSSFADERDLRRDHYLVFTLRRDQRRIPGALLRARQTQAEQEFLAEHPGLQRVPKQKREELREAVKGALLARTLPAPATYDVVWDTEKGLVTFASTSAKVMEAFEGLFRQSFEGLRLVSVHPFARASEVAGDELKEALDAANRADSDDVLAQIRDNAWLGSDFLLWLLHQTLSATSEYRVTRPGPALAEEEFVAYLNDKLVLMGASDSGVQKITAAGHQDRFNEVRTALRSGKQIVDATLYLEKQEDLWKTTLKGELFQFSGFKAPAVKPEKDEITDAKSEKEALFYERMHVLEEGLQLFDSLLAAFLRERLGPDWPLRDEEIRSWLEE